MKKTILLLFTISSLSLFGQEKLSIEIDNPQPRVDQRVTFSINIDFLASYLKKELGKNIELTRSKSIFGSQSDDFERVVVFKKAKKYKVGPFNFEFNGKKYTTNTIEIKVLPKLPMEEGLWLRLAEFEGDKYLILEQLVKNRPNKTINENGGYTHTIGGVKPEGIELADLNENLTEGIHLDFYSSSSNTLTPEGAELFDIGYTYSIKKYEITFDENFEGDYKISEKDIKNLPKIFNIGKIRLRK
ncbi:hypothetical protein [Pseudotenacibaculum haliotis]|uniref:Uncharacterized protein n=1 Tax=Pseudotenacibaculum haliotis TaxID=1862138 RepID=A0ABW5LSF0_9FLAO